MSKSKNTENNPLFRESEQSLKKRKGFEFKQALIYFFALLSINMSFSYFLVAGIGNFGFFTVIFWISFSAFFAIAAFLFYRKYIKKRPFEIYEFYIHIPGESIDIQFSNIKEVIGSRSLIGNGISFAIKHKGSINMLGPINRDEAEEIVKILKGYGVKAEIRSYIDRLKKEQPFHSNS